MQEGSVVYDWTTDVERQASCRGLRASDTAPKGDPWECDGVGQRPDRKSEQKDEVRHNNGLLRHKWLLQRWKRWEKLRDSITGRWQQLSLSTASEGREMCHKSARYQHEAGQGHLSRSLHLTKFATSDKPCTTFPFYIVLPLNLHKAPFPACGNWRCN